MAVIYGPTERVGVVTSGLVGYWDYYPGSGETWYDISGYGNNMRLYNSPTYNSSADKSFTFPGFIGGSTPYGQVVWDYANFPFGSGAFTLSCFFTSAAGTSGLNLFGIGGNDYNGGRACFQSGTNTIQCETRNSAFNLNQAISTNTWYHFVISCPGGTGASTAATMYVNGVSIGTTTTTVTLNIQQMDCCIATIPGYPFTAFWNGKIGSPMLYNRNLSSTEVAQNYSYLKGRYGL